MFGLHFNVMDNSLILALATMLISTILDLAVISALNIRQRSGTGIELKEGEWKYQELAAQLLRQYSCWTPLEI
jgi:hypothetical protein